MMMIIMIISFNLHRLLALSYQSMKEEWDAFYNNAHLILLSCFDISTYTMMAILNGFPFSFTRTISISEHIFLCLIFLFFFSNCIYDFVPVTYKVLIIYPFSHTARIFMFNLSISSEKFSTFPHWYSLPNILYPNYDFTLILQIQ